MPKATQDIDRMTASRTLRVSVRTIDRYIRSGKLSAKNLHGRILLNKKQINHLQKERGTAVPVRIVRHETPLHNTSSTPVASALKIPQEKFYKDLYEEARRALHDYQQKLEQANYRIGQLESRSPLPHTPSIPKIPDFREREEKNSYEFAKRELIEREKEIIVLQELVKKERASRVTFAILTYILLTALPIFWYLLR